MDLHLLGSLVYTYCRLPFYNGAVSGSALETLVGDAVSGSVLDTYCFVDVVSNGVGWQVKSTKKGTPLTWKRVKFHHEERDQLISLSHSHPEVLGSRILDVCNDHFFDSFVDHSLKEIRYVRLMVDCGKATLLEGSAGDLDSLILFDRDDFHWQWSNSSSPSFCGYNKTTGTKWFSWYGLGENQLHFHGEAEWLKSFSSHTFCLPDSSISLQELSRLLV